MSDRRFTYDAPDEAATAALGAALADVLPAGATVALYGTLGAGKTQLVRAIAAAAGVDSRQVVSPTFVLVQEYRGCRSICHIDAYRLRDEDEFQDLGPEEYFDGPGLTLVEWADRVAHSLPPERIDIRISVTGPQSRRFDVDAVGTRYAETLQQLAAKLAAGA